MVAKIDTAIILVVFFHSVVPELESILVLTI